MKCSICKEKIKGYGHNAQPINNGKCCDKCNVKKVIPERIKKLFDQFEMLFLYYNVTNKNDYDKRFNTMRNVS